MARIHAIGLILLSVSTGAFSMGARASCFNVQQSNPEMTSENDTPDQICISDPSSGPNGKEGGTLSMVKEGHATQLFQLVKDPGQSEFMADDEEGSQTQTSPSEVCREFSYPQCECPEGQGWHKKSQPKPSGPSIVCRPITCCKDPTP